MKKIITTLILLGVLGACAHSELKAPCSPTATLAVTPGSGCDPKPINVASTTPAEQLQ